MGNPSIECFSGWTIGDIPQSIDIIIFGVLKGIGVDVQIPSGVSKPCFSNALVSGDRHQGEQTGIHYLLGLSSRNVLEDSNIGIFLDFKEFPSLLNINFLFGTLFSDEIIYFAIMFRESIIGINDGEFGFFPTEFPIIGMPIKISLGHEEIVVLDGASKRNWWDIENGFTPVEVEVRSAGFVGY